jgi:hypothetical protein
VAFNDKPIISESSERSEASVLYTKNLLSQKNGFICREDTPDFGVDLQVELIENGHATNYRFVIQIKSSQSLNHIKKDEKEFISYKFLTSRLGYLCRHFPGYGLIIIYDDSTGIAYYDFIENIVTLLSSQKGSSEWQAQESVNIHIPVENILNTDSTKEIHEKFNTLFKNHSLLIELHGAEFNIHVLGLESAHFDIDLHDAKRVAKDIEDFGALLFNNRDFEILFSLINELTVREIDNSLDVRFIVSIALAETGRLTDADYHLRKLRANLVSLSKEKAALIRLYSAKIDFHFGRIDAVKYLHEVRSILPNMESAFNRLSTQLRIDSLDIVLAFGNMNRDIDEQLIKNLYDTIRDIEESKIEHFMKILLRLYAAGYLHQLGIKLLSTSIIRLRIKEKTFGPLLLADRVAEAQRVSRITHNALQMVQGIWESLSDKEKETILGAHVHYRLAEMFFSFSFTSFMLNGGASGNEVESPFLERYSFAITAFNIFIQNAEYDGAYSAITTAYEIGTLYDNIFNKEMKTPPIQDVIDRIQQLSTETGRAYYKSLVKEYVDENLPQIKKPQDGRDFVEMDDLEIDKYAQTYAATLGLPNNRIVRIADDLRAIKSFKSIFQDKDAVLLQDIRHTHSVDTLYASTIIYTGRCLHCGFTTAPSAVVENIIKEFSSSHGKSCLK